MDKERAEYTATQIKGDLGGIVMQIDIIYIVILEDLEEGDDSEPKCCRE